MTNLKQQLLQEGFVTQIANNQLEFYHNKYKTTIKNYSNISFETLVGLLKAIRKLDKLGSPNLSNSINIIIDNNQSIFLENKLDNSTYAKRTTVDDLQETVVNIYETHIRKEN